MKLERSVLAAADGMGAALFPPEVPRTAEGPLGASIRARTKWTPSPATARKIRFRLRTPEGRCAIASFKDVENKEQISQIDFDIESRCTLC